MAKTMTPEELYNKVIGTYIDMNGSKKDGILLLTQAKEEWCMGFVDFLEEFYPEWEEAIEDVRTLMKEYLNPE